MEFRWNFTLTVLEEFCTREVEKHQININRGRYFADERDILQKITLCIHYEIDRFWHIEEFMLVMAVK